MVLSARKAALEMLVRCRKDGAWSGAVIDNVIRKYDLSKRDASLASKICLGVIQNSSLCDYYIGCFCKSKLEPKVRDVLRIGIYQLLFLDRIPARAAVNEAVCMCRECGCSKAAGLVNAVLRKISDNINHLPEIPGEGTAEYLSIKYSHPLWLSEYIVDQKGYDFAEAFFTANNRTSGLTLQINTLKVSQEEYLRALNRFGNTYLVKDPEGCIELTGGNTTELPGFDEGFFYIQDRAARVAVEIADPKPGMNVLDCCSSPGGKSFASAIAMRNKGFILSSDIHEKKLNLVSNSAERLGINIISTKVMDARIFIPELKNKFDVVIADVPCSGMGVIGKKPEIRSKNKASIDALPVIQKEILNNVSEYVMPNGVLLYSTCTVMKEENENVVRSFLAAHSDFKAEGFDVCGIKADIGMYTFWPNVDGTDGFFVAKFRRMDQFN